MRWDTAQYGRYAGERGRPFLDLVNRVDVGSPRRVVDIGCGPGNMTALLAERWPDADIEGFDPSEDMIRAAQEHAGPRTTFRVQAAESWTVPPDADVVISNATLQRVKSHRELIRAWVEGLPGDGWFAFQVPSTFSSPAHAILREVALSAAYRDQARPAVRERDAVDEPQDYATLLLDLGLEVDAWETTYLHLLQGDDPVVEWIRSTRLQPVLDLLPPDAAAEFEQEYKQLVRAAYPRTKHGTQLPYRRLFAVGHKPC